MTLLTMNRDALANAHYDAFEWSGCEGSRWERVPPKFRRKHYQVADALLDSGAVIDAATLADDETIFARFQAALYPVTHNGHMFKPGVTNEGEIDPRWCDECGENTAKDALRALTAALTERGERP